ncbi:MAG: hypothetical protein JPMHGGIA_00460 [Saprospiraceae bacterium]|jgi:hypothetical protein|nr:hypothetical protein [Saprospiraceae bacterium]
MRMQSHPQKNTLLKNAQANAESNFFKRVFFSPTQEEIQIIFFPTLRFFNYLFFQRTVLTRTDTASNVNRFEQSVCELETTHLRTDSRAAGNMGLNEMAGEVVNQTFVLLINSSDRLTVRASKSATSLSPEPMWRHSAPHRIAGLHAQMWP